jgi:hypothetical protein
MTLAQEAAAPPRPISFPEHRKATSPGGRYAIVNVKSDVQPYHTVFLDDFKLKKRRKFFNYDRWVEELWNPDSSSFVHTDHAGSDFSECRIVSVERNTVIANVWAEIQQKSTAEERRQLTKNHHLYIAAQEWLNPKRLLVKVDEYGEFDRSGFTRFYEYEIGGHFAVRANGSPSRNSP